MRAAEATVLGTVAALGALVAPARAAPETQDCVLTRGDETLQLRFSIDRSSFAPALDPAEPPRRQVSRITLNGATFEAEALLTEDGVMGFWDLRRGLMLTRSPEGAARMTDDTGEPPWLGRCEETP